MSSTAPISDNNLISDTDNSLSISGLINRISSEDIDRLRQLLGVIPQQLPFAEEEDIETIFGDSLNNLPNLRIELTNEDSEGELDSVPVYKQPKRPPLQPKAISNNLRAALFDENLQPGFTGFSMETVFDNDIDWDLPKLKQPEKGPAISQSLANLINTACTSPCVTDLLVEKCRLPENCEKLAAPRVNNEIWKILNKRTQGYDKAFSDIKNLVAAGMTSVIQLADIVKYQISSNSEAKDLITNIITLMGQVQFNLSLRRRYMIRPQLKKKYSNLCNINMPITTNLFGDDIARDIKNCDTGISVAKENYSNFNNIPIRGRGNFRGFRGHRGYQRFQPYPAYGYPNYQNYGNQQNYAYGGSFRGMPRGFAPVRGKRQPTATMASSPNEGN